MRSVCIAAARTPCLCVKPSGHIWAASSKICTTCSILKIAAESGRAFGPLYIVPPDESREGVLSVGHSGSIPPSPRGVIGQAGGRQSATARQWRSICDTDSRCLFASSRGVQARPGHVTPGEGSAGVKRVSAGRRRQDPVSHTNARSKAAVAPGRRYFGQGCGPGDVMAADRTVMTCKPHSQSLARYHALALILPPPLPPSTRRADRRFQRALPCPHAAAPPRLPHRRPTEGAPSPTPPGHSLRAPASVNRCFFGDSEPTPARDGVIAQAGPWAVS
jgi:hypothetical protein